ncbi:uroporphyrinogen-III C-methyltransferase [Chamaesiphon minutus]|uniref:uroporphyrinogen-III C-methyltransferase n=1 Tax=Chamaesiphon minutus (strain ATCC 27169 / PCC 6605) TaxID=1173020 RepID=K9UIG0_CHAP6|nr:uroporphyrinogen-III C-methyltransferase [Chamaesiphon minutus]AFY94600.1 uroporphyrin-III C-methyltransferase [Chamaesiphon minutus PCC 6605]
MSKVYIVGAGPGDVSFLTLRAQQILTQAEILIYDALVDRGLLELVPETCVLVNVGKRGGQPSMLQSEIDAILVEYARTDRTVVRLKSGDPFIFGRVTAEIDALTAANCDYEVIPGLSTALVAPLLAGIPLTDPVLSRGFAVITAHLPDDLDWDALARIPTVVILMGTRQLAEVVAQFLKHDRSVNTPIAIIRWAGTSQQQIWVSDLGGIIDETEGVELSPSVMVVGQVVRLREYINCSASTSPISNELKLTHSQPSLIAGKTVLVTRAAGQASDFSQRLRACGARVIEMPTLEILPPSSWVDLDREIDRLNTFDWLILTSTNAVDAVFARLAVVAKDSRALAGVNIAAVGQKTAQSLKQHGITPDFIPPDFVADALVSNFPSDPHGQRILFPRVETGGREVLVREFTNLGATVVEVAAYQSQCPREIDPAVAIALQQQQIDIVTFASSKTVRNFWQLVGSSLPADWQSRVCIASIGPQTSATCRELLGRVDIEAAEYTLPGLVTALELGSPVHK